MRIAIAILFIAGLFVAIIGSPFAKEKPVESTYFFAPEKILPMTFAHDDHKAEACTTCHHNFTDNTVRDNCMNCHVSNKEVWPLLETQFHTLCRSCHEEKQAEGKEHGPTRACIACHMKDDKP